MKIKKASPLKEWHSSNKKYGTGDHYGTGVKNKIGKLRLESLKHAPAKGKIGKPPKSLA